MKFPIVFLLALSLFSAAPAFAGAPLGGIYFVCSSDPDQQRHFLGMNGINAMPDEAKRAAAESCENDLGGVPIHVVYVYKDGSQVEEGR